jgi:hypothetical protein
LRINWVKIQRLSTSAFGYAGGTVRGLKRKVFGEKSSDAIIESQNIAFRKKPGSRFMSPYAPGVFGAGPALFAMPRRPRATITITPSR